MRSFIFLLASTYALSPLVIKGNKFFQKDTGKQFFFKGVCYQPRGNVKSGAAFNDPLKDSASCKRDVAMFKDLGINTIRVYEVDPSANHDDCMKMLEDAGIYLALDLPSPNFSINRKTPSYDLEILNHYKAKVDAFIKYKNIAVFFAGNEINNDKTNTDANPFVKAGLRDIKAYIKAKGSAIPVGYANNDDTSTRQNIMNYFNCGDENERADFYSINVYAWCNAASFQKSGYPELTKELKDYSIPAFFSEFGCNTKGPREFVKEVDAMFGSEMNEIFSGGLMYEYTEEDNKYGLVEISGGKVKPKDPEFENLKKAYGAVSPPSTDMKAFSPSNTDASKCPSDSSTWMASSKLPPTPSANACSCMTKKLECVVNPRALDVSKSSDVGELFSYLCANGADCAKYISVNGTTGDYGAFSGCSAEQKLSWAFNAAYLKSGKNADACKENAMVQKAESGNINDCASIKTDIASGGKASSASHPRSALHLTVLLVVSAFSLST
ncbi:1 3-beta-glucanosyltransferase gel4 [Entomophthora muscae]|uniref:1 3-beta-glucanosyltransferase gel4 n=1 Tax=Entomophthora muscae TaxID=34485 RepID=A0ACC2RZK9_9FUNG|nr:1 3-beta-glucanosyltransferase gel4 [Entomophthora muscae]